MSSTDVTGARDTDLDEDDSHAESTLVHTVDLSTLRTHLLQSVTQYGVTQCNSLSLNPYDTSVAQAYCNSLRLHPQCSSIMQPFDLDDDDTIMSLGMSDLELRRQRLISTLPRNHPAIQIIPRTAGLLDDRPNPIPLTTKEWVVIDCCGGLASGLTTMLHQQCIIA